MLPAEWRDVLEQGRIDGLGGNRQERIRNIFMLILLVLLLLVWVVVVGTMAIAVGVTVAEPALG